MTNEEAIDVLMYLWRHEISERNTEGEIRRALNMGMAAIKREQRWIPVSERLPEERDWYLAVFKESDTGFQLIPRVADYIGMGENKWQLMYEDSLSSEYLDLLECVAWMPLPEPMKVGEENC